MIAGISSILRIRRSWEITDLMSAETKRACRRHEKSNKNLMTYFTRWKNLAHFWVWERSTKVHSHDTTSEGTGFEDAWVLTGAGLRINLRSRRDRGGWSQQPSIWSRCVCSSQVDMNLKYSRFLNKLPRGDKQCRRRQDQKSKKCFN